MRKSYKEITHDISTSLESLRKELPDVMNGFSALGTAKQ